MGGMPALTMMLRHLTDSEAINLASSSGVVETPSAPCSMILLVTCGSLTAATNSSLSLAMIRLWRAVRRQQREPSRRLVVLDARFRDRGNVGKRGHALARRNGERPGVAALEGRVNVRQPLETHRHRAR